MISKQQRGDPENPKTDLLYPPGCGEISCLRKSPNRTGDKGQPLRSGACGPKHAAGLHRPRLPDGGGLPLDAGHTDVTTKVVSTSLQSTGDERFSRLVQSNLYYPTQGKSFGPRGWVQGKQSIKTTAWRTQYDGSILKTQHIWSRLSGQQNVAPIVTEPNMRALRASSRL